MIRLSEMELAQLVLWLSVSLVFFGWSWLRYGRERTHGLVTLFLLVCGVCFFLFVKVVDRSSGISFGKHSPELTFALMYLFVCLGIGAEYLKHASIFRWSDFIRAFLISPITLIPLQGSMRWDCQVDNGQLIQHLLLAFGTGYFWKSVLSKVKKDFSGTEEQYRPSQKNAE